MFETGGDSIRFATDAASDRGIEKLHYRGFRYPEDAEAIEEFLVSLRGREGVAPGRILYRGANLEMKLGMIRFDRHNRPYISGDIKPAVFKKGGWKGMRRLFESEEGVNYSASRLVYLNEEGDPLKSSLVSTSKNSVVAFDFQSPESGDSVLMVIQPGRDREVIHLDKSSEWNPETEAEVDLRLYQIMKMEKPFVIDSSVPASSGNPKDVFSEVLLGPFIRKSEIVGMIAWDKSKSVEVEGMLYRILGHEGPGA